jgi:hypothetical protein
MLTADQLRQAGKCCVGLHNYCIQNYKMGQEIIVQYKDHHFLVGDYMFVITFYDLYELFKLDVLGIFLMRCFTL